MGACSSEKGAKIQLKRHNKRQKLLKYSFSPSDDGPSCINRGTIAH